MVKFPNSAIVDLEKSKFDKPWIAVAAGNMQRKRGDGKQEIKLGMRSLTCEINFVVSNVIKAMQSRSNQI